MIKESQYYVEEDIIKHFDKVNQVYSLKTQVL